MKLLHFYKLPAILIIILPAWLFTGCSKSSNPTPPPPPPPPAQKTVTVSNFAGAGSAGKANGQGDAASFSNPTGVAADLNGNVYVADHGNFMVRKITADGTVSTFAGDGSDGSANGPALTSSFNSPFAIAVDPSGNVFVTDQGNLQIREISAGGTVSIFAGSGLSGSANGAGTAASFSSLQGITSDATGDLYVTDGDGVRKITPAGVVSTIVPVVGSSLEQPAGIAVDTTGNIYVSDPGHNLIRKITSKGVISTLAGNGKIGHADGVGLGASFNSPAGLAIDAGGNLYVADKNNKLIRMVAPDGTVTTLAGGGIPPDANGSGSHASFDTPVGVTIDKFGNIYVSDSSNNRIRKVNVQQP